MLSVLRADIDRRLSLALPFGLFERVLHTNSATRIIQESTRLESLNDLLTQAGVEKEVYADFVDPTFELLQELASLVTEGKIDKAEGRLLEAFNDPEIGNAVIMHFRVGYFFPLHMVCSVSSYPPLGTSALYWKRPSLLPHAFEICLMSTYRHIATNNPFRYSS